MNYGEVVNRFLTRYKLILGVKEEVKVKIRRYNTKTAFVDLRSKIIYINRDLLDLGEDVIEYLLLHELLHIKLGAKHHTAQFYTILHFFIPEEKVNEIKEKMIEKLIKINRNNSRNNN
jgi:predicted metal-dependent hydrolase